MLIVIIIAAVSECVLFTYYSSPLASPSTISIVFNVLDIAAGQSRLVDRKGVCTGWLESDAVIGVSI